MELEIPAEDPKTCMMLGDRLAYSMGGVKLRIKEVAMMWETNSAFEMVFTTDICVPEDLNAFTHIALGITSNSIVPAMVQEFHQIGFFGKPFFHTRFVLLNNMTTINFLNVLAVGIIVRLENFPGKEIVGCSFRSLEPMPAVSVTEPEFHREAGHTVLVSKNSSCGYWTHRVRKNNQTNLRKMEESLPCQLGVLCKKHTDPFNYWYHQNLPRRVYQEPFWDGLSWPILAIEEQHQRNVTALRARIARDEKWKKLNHHQVDVPSWGFKSLKNGGKIQKKKEKNHILGYE